MSDIIFNESMILKLDGQKTNREVLSAMADHLFQKGLVKETYKEAILNREKEFPTGLFTGNLNVAIPHADTRHVNNASLCVGIAENPVKFYAMDEPDNIIDINMVFMLALKEAHGHIEMLQKVISLIQDQEAVEKMIKAKDLKAVYEIVEQHLL